MNITAFNNGALSSNSLSNLVQSSYEDSDDSFSKTPTNSNASNILREINLQNKVGENRVTINENFGTYHVRKNEDDTDNDENDVTLEEKMLNDVERLLYSNNSDLGRNPSTKLATMNSHSLPQLPIYTYPNCYASKTMSESEPGLPNDTNSSRFISQPEVSTLNYTENQSSGESIRSMHSSSTSSLLSNSTNKKENKESKAKII
jgi:hypothetical protein